MPIPQLTLDDYEREYAGRHLLHQVVAKWAREKPDEPAMVSAGMEFGITWRQFERTTSAIAVELLDLGFRKGDFVATLLPFLRARLADGRCSQSVEAAQENPKRDSKYDIQRCTPKVIGSIGHRKSPEFHFRKGEKYLHSPIVACEILESGEIAHELLKRSSGIAEVDNYAVR